MILTQKFTKSFPNRKTRNKIMLTFINESNGRTIRNQLNKNRTKKKFNYKNKNEKSAYSLIYNTGFKRTNFSVTMNKFNIVRS